MNPHRMRALTRQNPRLLRAHADGPDLGPDPRRGPAGGIDDRDAPAGEALAGKRWLGVTRADRRACVREDGLLRQRVVASPAAADGDLPGGAKGAVGHVRAVGEVCGRLKEHGGDRSERARVAGVALGSLVALRAWETLCDLGPCRELARGE